ncbi:MAG: adenosylcobalamin-dependent ribonucleoside-diphosphate reductase, partial [Beijerinckiaceae bacterium]
MSSDSVGPTLPFSERTHSLKYRNEGESFRESQNRIAAALKEDDEHFHSLRQILLDMRFLAAGRVQAAMGSPRKVTPYNCFVSDTIADSFIDGDGSIMQRATEAAQTMRLGGGIGYDFSTLRPRGSLIKSLNSSSSGVVSFMQIFNAVCGTVSSAGHRRGAQMGVLRVDHPDIEEFVHAKQNTNNLTNFNMSVAITDEFMWCVETGRPFVLKFNGQTYREIDAAALWEAIMRSTWDWAEPGVLFIDQINKMNNLWYCEHIAATNPCGEQPLPPNGACLLGSFNLVKYVFNIEGVFFFDFYRLTQDIPVIVRAMDNVIDRAVYPLPAQRLEATSKRRMGLGVTGMANAIEAVTGQPYGSEGFLTMQSKILSLLRNECYRASAVLAKEKGSFPLFNKEKYLQGGFIKTLPLDVINLISQYGIRNSHLTSIAPCGTISLSADNVSSGIEPVFAYDLSRDVIEETGRVRI